MARLTLEQATRIVDAALDKGAETECKPLTVAVLDDVGHLKVLKRQDGCAILRPQIAMGKARAARVDVQGDHDRDVGRSGASRRRPDERRRDALTPAPATS